MGYLQLIFELVTLLQKYGPAGAAILADAEAAFKAGGWPALLAYLASLAANPPAMGASKMHLDIAALHAKMAAA